MTNDRLVEILRAVLVSLENKGAVGCGGICGHLVAVHYSGKMTEEEKDIVHDILYANKPNYEQFTEFTKSEWWTSGSFWWKPLWKSSDALPIRIEFVKALINKYNISTVLP